MSVQEPTTLSYCENCGFRVFSRYDLCPNCEFLPFNEDRRYTIELGISDDSDEWTDEEFKRFEDWSVRIEPKYCKDCGMSMEDVVKYYDSEGKVDKKTGIITWENFHPCNPDSPTYD